MFLDYFALFLVFFVLIVIFYAIIAIHDIPYEIARHRDHPHQDAIHIAGWVSLFTLHVLWPLLWIWAALYRADRGWGIRGDKQPDHASVADTSELDQLRQQVATLEQRLTDLSSAKATESE